MDSPGKETKLESRRMLKQIGNYKLGNVSLGKGSFASVRLAEHLLLGSEVALKITDISRIQDPYIRANLQREAAILTQLSHPNVVKLMEICSTRRFYCLVLEYVPGAKSISDVLEENGPLVEEAAIGITRQVVSAMMYIHSRGILHRDLKLDNILLDGSLSRCFIIDFGLSNYWHHGKLMTTHCGTCEYAAPELFNKENLYGPGIDVWSFGIILHGMLFSFVPFQLDPNTGDTNKLVRTILEGLTEDHHKALRAQLSCECHQLISSCLAVDPNLRISFGEIAQHPWITRSNSYPPVELGSHIEAGMAKKVKVATTLNQRLKLGMAADRVISYIEKQPYKTTGGCFNILMQELKDEPLPQNRKILRDVQNLSPASNPKNLKPFESKKP